MDYVTFLYRVSRLFSEGRNLVRIPNLFLIQFHRKKKKSYLKKKVLSGVHRQLKYDPFPFKIMPYHNSVVVVPFHMQPTIRKHLLEDMEQLVLIPGEGHGNPHHYSCLENPVDRGAWWATVHRVQQSHTRLKQLGMHTCTPT